MAEEPHPTLAWPAHDSGPTPPPHSTDAERGERSTRKKQPFWDRVKFLIALTILFFLFVWADMANIPILPFRIEQTQPSKSLQYFITASHWLTAANPPSEQHLPLEQHTEPHSAVPPTHSHVHVSGFNT